MQPNLVQREKFTPLQRHILRQMGVANRFAVIGGPGTGKTVLALEGFNQVLAEEDASRVAFMVYNKALRAFLMRYVNHTEPESVVTTWHSWLPRYVMRTFNIDFETFKQRYQTRDYTYDWDALKRDLSQQTTEKAFYTIFVDEAQDFPEPLLEIIAQATSRLYVFFDENQKFTPDLLEENRAFSMVEQTALLGLLDLDENYYDLIENFRNTQPIERVAKTYEQNYLINNITLRRTTVTKEGPLPVLKALHDKATWVKDLVDELMAHPHTTIGVLIPKVAGHKALLDGYRDLFLADRRLHENNFYVHSREREQSLNASGIFLMTYQVAKGLEFDHVVLPELNHPMFRLDYYQRNAFYVSVTRAKTRLTMLYEPSLADSEVIKIAKRYAQWFEHAEMRGVVR